MELFSWGVVKLSMVERRITNLIMCWMERYDMWTSEPSLYGE